MTSERVRGELVDGRPVKTYLARRAARQADHRAREGGFARARFSDHAKDPTGADLEGYSRQDGTFPVGCDDGQPHHRQARRRPGQRQGRRRGRHLSGQPLQIAPGGPCALRHGPLGHADLDRRKRAAQHDGGRDHRPGRHLALQDEPGTDRQHRRLQEQPEGTGEGAEGPGPVARARQPGLGHVLHGDPAIRHGLRHALRADEITRVFGPTRETLRLGVQGAAVAHPACGQDLIEDRGGHEDHSARHTDPAQKRVKDEDRGDENRGPWRIHQRQAQRRGVEAADRFDIR